MEGFSVIPFANFGQSVVTLVFNTGPFAKFLLLLLFVMSVISWAIIYDRARLYLRLLKSGQRLAAEVQAKGLAVSMSTVQKCLPSVEGALLIEAKGFLEEQNAALPDERGQTMNALAANQLKNVLEGRATAEFSEMEKYLIFLATTASVSPFLGLLGTVWGILSSFLSMGIEGTASIEVVGPGIAEALTTTIAGLGAAITALIGYNLLIRHVRRQESRIDLFISRVLRLTTLRTAHPSHVENEATYEKKPI